MDCVIPNTNNFYHARGFIRKIYWLVFIVYWMLEKGAPCFVSDLNLKSFKFKSTMMTSSNGNIFRVTGHLSGEFPPQRPVTRSFDVFFDLRLNKRLSKQSWGWWFETLWRSLWRLRNDSYGYCNIHQVHTLGTTHGMVFDAYTRHKWSAICFVAPGQDELINNYRLIGA